MIGKISSGKGYGGTIAYVLGPGERDVPDRATVLYHTMSSDNPEHWAIEMEEHARGLNPDLLTSGRSDLVVHVSLSAAPGERLGKDQWIAVASEYLRQMGWAGHDYIVVQHSDRPHDHIHLIVNRVGADGQTADLHNDYQRQAAALEHIEKQFGLEESHSQMRHAAEADPTRAITSITQSHLTFEARDVARYFQRLGFDEKKATDLTGRALASVQVLGTADGRYTTLSVQREVSGLNERFSELASRTHGALVDFAPAVNPKRLLSDDQQSAREAIAAGRDLTVIRGFAGAGKSAMLEQARADLEQSGYRVIGAAPTGKASAGLNASSGIQSSTIARLVGQLEHGSVKFDSRTVLVVDEAGMARLDDTSRLAAAVSAAGGRLVLVGDDRQLQAVGRGGALTLATQHVRSTTLNQIWRQADSKDETGKIVVDRQWMRDATRAFGEGRTADGIRAYTERNQIKWSASVGSSVRDMVLDYATAYDNGKRPSEMLAMAHRNEHVSALNQGIREVLKERGLLQEGRTYDLTRGGGKRDIDLAVGDRVVLTQNPSQRLANSLGIGLQDVQNGMFGTVTALSAEDNRIVIQMDKGSLVRLNLDEYGHLAHGYAATIHKSQGASIQQTFVLISRAMDAFLAYVGLTRHTEWTRAYGNTVDFKDADQLIAKLSKSTPAENFNQIVAASAEQKLKNVYGFSDAQIAQYLENHPQLGAQLEALGIGPSHQGSYLRDTGRVLQQYGNHVGALLQRYEDVLRDKASPGEFKDTRNLFEKLKDDLMWSMFGPRTTTEYVIYRVSELVLVNAGFAAKLTVDLGVTTARAAGELGGVAIRHGVPAIAEGLRRLAAALSDENSKLQPGKIAEKGSVGWSNMPSMPDTNSAGWTPGEQRYIEKSEAIQPANWRETQKYLDSIRDYCQKLNGSHSPDQSPSSDKGAGKPNDSHDRPRQDQDKSTTAGPEVSNDNGKGPEQRTEERERQKELEGKGAGGDQNSGKAGTAHTRDKTHEQCKPGAAPGHDGKSAGSDSSTRAGQGQSKPTPAADPGTSSLTGNEQSSGKESEAGRSSSTGGQRDGGANEPGKGKDAAPNSGMPALTLGQSASGGKGSEQGSAPTQSGSGKAHGQNAGQGSSAGKGAGQSNGSSAGRGADSPSGEGANQGAGSSTSRSGTTQAQGNSSGKGAGQSNGLNGSRRSSSTGDRPGSTPNNVRSSSSRPGQAGSSNAGSRHGQSTGAGRGGNQPNSPNNGNGGNQSATSSGSRGAGQQKPGQAKPGQQKPEKNSSSNGSGNDKGYGRERYH